MATSRKPGPQCSFTEPVDIGDGTMCRAQSPAPGPLGLDSGVAAFVERGQCLKLAFARVPLLASLALYRETGRALDSELKTLVPEIVLALKSLTASAAGRANTIHSSVSLSQPQLGSKAVLVSLGLDFLSEDMDTRGAEVDSALHSGLTIAQRGDGNRKMDRVPEIDRAAEELARGVAILVRLILQGIVAYLLKRGSSGGAALATASKGVRDDSVAQLVRRLRSGKVGRTLAPWVQQHWKELVTNAQLRPMPRRRAGGSPAAAGSLTPERMPRPAAISSPPAAEPPTFSDINFATQAATLLAAATQGAPFCPV